MYLIKERGFTFGSLGARPCPTGTDICAPPERSPMAVRALLQDLQGQQDLRQSSGAEKYCFVLKTLGPDER